MQFTDFGRHFHAKAAETKAATEARKAAKAKACAETGQATEACSHAKTQKMITLHMKRAGIRTRHSTFWVWVKRMAKKTQLHIVTFLGVCGAAGMIASFVLAMRNQPTPDTLIFATGTCIGALANALVPRDEQPARERHEIGSLIER